MTLSKSSRKSSSLILAIWIRPWKHIVTLNFRFVMTQYNSGLVKCVISLTYQSAVFQSAMQNKLIDSCSIL